MIFSILIPIFHLYNMMITGLSGALFGYLKLRQELRADFEPLSSLSLVSRDLRM